MNTRQVNCCVACGGRAIAVKADGRFVTTCCSDCSAIVMLEFDPPDEPHLRARIERIDEQD
jgi:hypothetical protein